MTDRSDSPFHVADTYGYYGTSRTVTAEEVIAFAGDLLIQRLRKTNTLTSAEDTKRYVSLQLARSEREIFACLFLDNRHRLIEYEELFLGTIDGSAVYPREIVKRALTLNASAIILAHNHPSGVAEPSNADIQITQRIVEILTIVDVRVLDHIVIGDGTTVSFAERGLMT